MTKTIKKRFTSVLALVLALAMGLTAYAADDSTITNIPPHNVIVEGGLAPPPAATGTDLDTGTEGSSPDEEAPEEALPPDEEVPEETDEEVIPDILDSDSYGHILDASSIIVTTYDELKRALSEDNGYTTIYLGADIMADNSGVSIHPGKEAVILDGSPPTGGRYTFTQYQTADTTRLLRVDSAGAVTSGVTVRNIDIVGKNIYGVVWVAANLQHVILTFENVNYNGPQAVYHRGGTVRFLGGRYTLGSGEMAEALYIELGGTLHIESTNVATAILWMTSTASTLTVLEGADVTVNASFYFIYGTITSATIQRGASLSLTSKRFGFSYAADTVGTFLIEQDASFALNLHTVESYAALRVSKRFEMEPGSSATIIRTGAAGIALRLTTANAQAMFDRPQRVFFYSGAGVPLRFTGAGTISITTSALNVWGKTAWPLAGGMDTLPDHIWNKAGGELLTLTGQYYETLNQSLVHNLAGDDPIVSELTSKAFDLEHSQLLAFGSHVISVDIPTDKGAVITGGTLPGAQLHASYTFADGTAGSATGSADGTGRYRLPVTDSTLLAGSAVTVLSLSHDLVMRQRETVRDASEHRLAFVSLPDSIQFGALSVPHASYVVQPAQPGLSIAVEDSRLTPAPWRIDASLMAPLSAIVGGERRLIPGAVVFRTMSGETLTLGDAPQPVYRQSDSLGGTVDLQWGDGEGVLLSLSPGSIYSGAEYSTAIHWTLVDAP